MRDLVVFFGSLRDGEYESILKAGYSIGLLLDTSRGSAPSKGDSDLSWLNRMDFKEGPQAILNVLRALTKSHRLLALLNTRESYVRDHAWICEQLRLPAIPREAVDRVTNKTLMRAAFVRELGETSTARFKEIQSEQDLLDFAKVVPLPIILKPNHLAASLFVKRIDQFENLISAYRECIKKTQEYDLKNGISTCTDALIQAEEYLEGSLHSIDVWVGNDEVPHPTPVIDVITGKDLGRNDFHHFSRTTPSYLGDSREHQAQVLAFDGIRALGLKNCIAHVEFIWTQNGPRLLEIAARAGAHRNRLLQQNHGIELNWLALEAGLGKSVSFAPKHKGSYAIVTPFPIKKQRFYGIRGLEQILELPSYHAHEIKIEIQQEFGPASEGFYSTFQIELKTVNEEGLKSDIQSIRELDTIFETEPSSEAIHG